MESRHEWPAWRCDGHRGPCGETRRWEAVTWPLVQGGGAAARGCVRRFPTPPTEDEAAPHPSSARRVNYSSAFSVKMFFCVCVFFNDQFALQCWNKSVQTTEAVCHDLNGVVNMIYVAICFVFNDSLFDCYYFVSLL